MLRRKCHRRCSQQKGHWQDMTESVCFESLAALGTIIWVTIMADGDEVIIGNDESKS